MAAMPLAGYNPILTGIPSMKNLPSLYAICSMSALISGAALAQTATEASMTAESINTVKLSESALAEGQSAGMARLQIALDRAGFSPGVIDGYAGENVNKAIGSAEQKLGLPQDGKMDAELAATLEFDGPALKEYVITEEDLSDLSETIPDDYAEKAEMKNLGFTTVEEKLAERFHMDVDFLKGLNTGSDFSSGSTVLVADIGEDVTGAEVARIEADKNLRQLRVYDEAGTLVVSYPATIGSEETPSPSGTHQVQAVAIDPTYTYNPDKNFQQGDNTEPLTIPPGPNGPVGSVWIDLSEPTYGIHGTPEPSEIDKTQSHGCVRLTNWDANELAHLVDTGVEVKFLP